MLGGKDELETRRELGNEAFELKLIKKSLSWWRRGLTAMAEHREERQSERPNVLCLQAANARA